MDNFKVIESKKIYDGFVVKLMSDKVAMPNGNIVNRDWIDHSGAAAIIPVDKDGNIILTRQYRHACKQYFLEIPAGKLETDEDPLSCAKRELEEEIGYKADQFSFMFKTHIAIGYSNEVISFYLAKELVESVQNLDEDEFIEVETYSLAETLDFIKTGEITDSKTIAGILFYAQFCK